MKKTFQKTLIAVATGVVLMSAVGTASANSLLFPYFTTATGAQSVLSISGNSTIGSSFNAPERLHYVYNYGASCTHFDGNGFLTANDVMQHSIASTAAGGFGKAVSTDRSSPFHFPLKDTTGFLVVSSMSTAGGAATISGDMAIVDPSTGLVTSYAGISNNLDTGGAVNQINEGNFAAITDTRFNLSFYGAAAVSTSWYGVVVGDMSTVIRNNGDWTGNNILSNGGLVWNNDEVPFSGTSFKRVACSGNVVAADLMNAAQLAAIGSNGGLIHVTGNPAATDVNGNPVAISTGLVMSKIQTVQAIVGAPFAGKQFMHREQGNAF